MLSAAAPAPPFPLRREQHARVDFRRSHSRVRSVGPAQQHAQTGAEGSITALGSEIQPLPPCVVHEDADMLIVNKPAGWATHAPSPFASEGIYDWLRSREPRWAKLAIIHRLDKDTSGLLAFGKSPLANKSLTEQFASRTAEKLYTLLVPLSRGRAGGDFGGEWVGGGDRRARVAQGAGGFDAAGDGQQGARLTEALFSSQQGNREGLVEVAPAKDGWVRVSSYIRRQGDVYVTRSTGGKPDEEAVTLFRAVGPSDSDPSACVVLAKPLTGRTHQIRVHAAALGHPVLGDIPYGGRKSGRLWLHSTRLAVRHPADPERTVEFTTAPESPQPSERAARGARLSLELPNSLAFFEGPGLAAQASASAAQQRWSVPSAATVPSETDLFRVSHGAGSPGGVSGVFADCLGPALLVQTDTDLPPAVLDRWVAAAADLGCSSVYVKRLRRDVRTTDLEEACPRLLSGPELPARFSARENGLTFLLSFTEGYSIGLFLDQRDNRRRVLTGHVAPGFGPLWRGGAGGVGGAKGSTMLNCFAYTCGFSVAAAAAGATVTSLDLSQKYLAWGKANMEANGLDPSVHDWVFGDCFDWLKRFGKKGRVFDCIVLDPPTFSRSKRGDWRAERDWGLLTATALAVLAPGGVLLASTNAARLPPEEFMEQVRGAVVAAGRRVDAEHFAPAAPDFPATKAEPGYLKTVWMRIS